MKKNTVIIGAGITGLSCAFHLKDNYFILEKEHFLGGLCRSVDQGGFTFDFSGHGLHLRDKYAKELCFNLLKDNLLTVNRNAYIYTHKVHVPFPFQANLFFLPENIRNECVEKFKCRKSINLNKSVSFYDWVLATLGEGIGKYFMFPYNSKLWSFPLEKLTTDWINIFVPQPTIEEIIQGASEPQKNIFGYNAQFFYPKYGGCQALIDSFSAKIKNIKCGVHIEHIDLLNKKITTSNGDIISYNNLVSTIPLIELLKLFQQSPSYVTEEADKLVWNSVLCINIGVNRAGLSDRSSNKSWIYFPENEYIFYRVGFYSNFSKYTAPDDCSSMYIEISYKPSEDITNDIVSHVIRDLCKCNITTNPGRIKEINVLPIRYAYVIYDENRTKALSVINKYLGQHDVFSIGRYGAWKYSYMEESILDGRDMANYLNSSQQKAVE